MQGVAGFFRHMMNSSFSGKTDVHDVTVKNDDSKACEATETAKEGNSAATSPGRCNTNDALHERPEMDKELIQIRETIYDLIKDIRDPEKPQTLEELEVVCEENVFVQHFNEDEFLVKIVFVPTVPHCSLASLIGLCMRQKLIVNLPDKHKLDIFIKEGTHETAEDINKQINDKERIAAAMENPNLRELVNQCINEEQL